MKTTLQNWQEDERWNHEKGKQFAPRVRVLSQSQAARILQKYEKLAPGRESQLSKLPHGSTLNLLMHALIDGEVPESELPPVPSEDNAEG